MQEQRSLWPPNQALNQIHKKSPFNLFPLYLTKFSINHLIMTRLVLTKSLYALVISLLLVGCKKDEDSEPAATTVTTTTGTLAPYSNSYTAFVNRIVMQFPGAGSNTIVVDTSYSAGFAPPSENFPIVSTGDAGELTVGGETLSYDSSIKLYSLGLQAIFFPNDWLVNKLAKWNATGGADLPDFEVSNENWPESDLNFDLNSNSVIRTDQALTITADKSFGSTFVQVFISAISLSATTSTISIVTIENNPDAKSITIPQSEMQRFSGIEEIGILIESSTWGTPKKIGDKEFVAKNTCGWSIRNKNIQ